MRSRRHNISVFSISALDLFAASLGAFILIVLVLFPYYRQGGTDQSMEELEDLVKARRFAAQTSHSEMAQIRALQAQIRLLEAQYRTRMAQMSRMQQRLREVQARTASITIPKPVAQPVQTPRPVAAPPRSVARGQAFSILGLGTSKKKIAILVDMSGSMEAHRGAVVAAINEVLDQMQPDFRFVILGYRGGPTYDAFPPNGRMVAASASTVRAARRFVAGMARRFGGGTPTQNALVRALNLHPEAIILMSDGAPDDGDPDSIIRNISARNRGRTEIHTVAIGDYTQDPRLTLFLQELALRNRGEFVGRAR